jgi:hypothetical protein
MAILADAVDILIDHDGYVAYLQDDNLYEFDSGDTTIVGASVTFNNSDLGESGVEKLVNFVDADYEGSFILSFYFDDVLTYNMTFADKSTRGTLWKDFPLTNRRPFQKLKLYISSATLDTKIYSIEVDFNVLRRRRFN